LTLRQLYRLGELPGENPLNLAQEQLDAAVQAACGMTAKENPLAFLLHLNLESATREDAGHDVGAPGLPAAVTDATPFMSDDCILMN
jgi:hypothetical protein